MGGGSADAAYTVRALNTLFSLGLSNGAMAEIVSSIGADCPFFVYNSAIVVSGIGTTLRKVSIPTLSGLTIVICRPDGCHVSTAQAYAGVAKNPNAIPVERITELRSSIMKAPQGADVMGMENELTRALGSLLAVSENYPELKANENFLKLQEELTSTENRIAFSRGYFNEAVKNFNTAIRLFPASIISGALNFHPRDMWNLEGNAAEREPVAVKF